ncbi:MAG: glycosyltransferase [Ignavibacteria bacterium]|nr:glycosyltransferase [Ignavibacteria bacterium]
MSEKNINISVLMPVYNASRYLKNSVRSILNQTFREFEFLIIDDGSTDDSEEIVSSFSDSRIIYKKIPRSGLSAALNYGLEIASGDWIARIDADDLNTPDRIRIQNDFILKNPEYNVVSGCSVYFRDPCEILFVMKVPEFDSDIKNFLNLHNPVNHSAVMFNRKIICQNGGYNEQFSCFEDFELWHRLKDKLNFRILPEYLVFTRLHSRSHSYKADREKIYRMLSDNNQENDLFWVEYFYGNRKECRKYFFEEFSLRKLTAFVISFFPLKVSDSITELRLMSRIKTKRADKKKFEVELKKLLL